MKLSKILLSAMSVAVLSSCVDKSKNDVKPNTEQSGQQAGENNPNGENGPHCCPACGMG